MRKPAILVLHSLLLLALAGCGGGKDDGGSVPPPTPQPPADISFLAYTPGVYHESALLADRCQLPRSGIDPWTGRAWPDRGGTALTEKLFLRSWTNELYLWFDEVPDRNPGTIGGTGGGVPEYFDLLKTEGLTASGAPRDRFHYTWPTDEYRDLATTGALLGYGISWSIVRGTVPRQVVVEYVQPETPAAAAGVRRGATLLQLGNIDVVNNNTEAGVSWLNSTLFSPLPGTTVAFTFRDREGYPVGATLTASRIAFDSVPVVDVIHRGSVDVGYLLFNDHTGASEAALRDAMNELAAAQVDELVLDLRYNGGGYLDVASELAYMIAGPAATAERAFERLQFNSKHPTRNPVTREPIEPLPFLSTTQGYAPGLPAGTPLPYLGLDRVFVLTSELTCSASESIINGLRGIGITVHQIGGNTCGKPYGFYARDNCGTTYFSIQFRGVNDAGFGDYADGFSATRAVGDPQARLPGCLAADDLMHDLGDPAEGQLATALAYLATGICPATPLSMRPQAAVNAAEGLTPVLRQPAPLPWKNNRVLR